MSDGECRCGLVRGNLVVHPECPWHIAPAPISIHIRPEEES